MARLMWGSRLGCPAAQQYRAAAPKHTHCESVEGRRFSETKGNRYFTIRFPFLSMLNFLPGGTTVVALYSVTTAGPR